MSLLEIRDLEVTYAGHAGTRVRAVAHADLDVEAGARLRDVDLDTITD